MSQVKKLLFEVWLYHGFKLNLNGPTQTNFGDTNMQTPFEGTKELFTPQNIIKSNTNQCQ